MNNNINTQQSQLKVLVFDNYDSFTYNLVRSLKEFWIKK
jgi:anthranilate synthase component 2